MTLSTFKMFKKLKEQPGWVTLDDRQLQQLQSKIEGITKDIFDFCNRKDINVMLGFGSVLGAVRHQGFIPWDDDMDLYMTRKDYMKFIEEFPKEYKERYWLHTPEKTTNYGSLIAKVLLKGTIVRKYEDNETDECGVFVDIFILENEFDNVILQKIHSFVGYLFAGFVSCRRFYRDAKYIVPMLNNEPELRKVVKRKERIGKMLSILSLDTWVHMANWWFSLCKNDQSRYVSIPTFTPKLMGDKWERKVFGSGVKIAFGKNYFRIPQKSEYYLSRIYGDYMKIPAVEDREKHAYLEFKI